VFIYFFILLDIQYDLVFVNLKIPMSILFVVYKQLISAAIL